MYNAAHRQDLNRSLEEDMAEHIHPDWQNPPFSFLGPSSQTQHGPSDPSIRSIKFMSEAFQFESHIVNPDC